MTPSATGYVFLLLIGILSLAETLAVVVFAWRHPEQANERPARRLATALRVSRSRHRGFEATPR